MLIVTHVRLVGAVAHQHDLDGLGHDDEIEGGRPVLDVVEIQAHALFPVDLLAAGDLPQTCEPGLGEVTAVIGVIHERHFIEHHGARADQ